MNSTDLAQTALHSLLAQQAGGGGGLLGMLPPIVMMIGIFYLLMWRPQQKQAREHQQMILGLKKGDEVVTQSGIVGKVHAVTDKFVMLEVARDVRLRVLKSAVQGKVPEGSLSEAEGKAEPAKAEARADKDK